MSDSWPLLVFGEMTLQRTFGSLYDGLSKRRGGHALKERERIKRESRRDSSKRVVEAEGPFLQEGIYREKV